MDGGLSSGKPSMNARHAVSKDRISSNGKPRIESCQAVSQRDSSNSRLMMDDRQAVSQGWRLVKHCANNGGSLSANPKMEARLPVSQ